MHINKGEAFWDSVLWSEESKFQIFDSKKQQRVWRRPCNALLDRNLKKTVKHAGGSLMVWGCFTSQY